MALALVCGQALEHGVWAHAAGAWRAIDLTTFESEWRRLECDSEPEQRPTAEARVRTLLEIGKKPSVDSSSFRQLLTAQSEFGPTMSDAAGQVAHQHSSVLSGRLRTFKAGICRCDVLSPLSWSR